MSVRKRKWIGPAGDQKQAWVVDFRDLSGVRRLRTFRLKKEADRYATKVRAEHLTEELKAKGPAEVAASTPSQVQSQTKRNEYVDSNSTQSADGATELPVERVNRLSRELSEALNGWMDGEFMAVILPATRGNGYPIMFGNIENQKEAISHQAVRAS